MAKQKTGRPRLEYSIRIIEVQSVQMHVSRRIDDRNAALRTGGDTWMQLRGTCDEPLEGQTEIEVSIHELGELASRHDKTKSIGALIQVRPYVHVLVDLPTVTFERTWALAAGAKLSHVWISMTKPLRSHAFVVSVSFTNEPIE